jgi:Peptidase M76 family
MSHPDEPSKKKASCNHCVQLLQDLFSNPSNQSSRLLYNMLHSSLPSPPPPSFDAVVPNNVQTLPNGIRIRIPTTTDNSSSEAITAAAPVNHSSSKDHPLDSSTLIRRLSYNSVPPSVRPDENDWIEVTCRRCSDFGLEANARAFVMGPSPLSIVVCQNRILPAAHHLLPEQSVQEMDEIVTHELIHIYDVRTLKLDLLQCSDLAYSEIRAARAAECAAHRRSDATPRSANIRPRWSSLLSTSAATNGNMTTTTNEHGPRPDALEQCVRSRATTATQNLFAPARAQRCIQQVFAEAMADERPAGNAGDPAE